MVTNYQPVTLAGMEGLFKTEQGADVVLIGQPDMEKQTLDNAIHIPNALSFITYRHWNAEVKGLDAFPPEDHPDNIPLLYYSFHIMVGLGTIFIAIMVLSAFGLWRGWLERANWLMWIIMLSFPLPFIANTAGWMVAEIGRQPWLVYGLYRTERRVFAAGVVGECAVHADRIFGNVHGAVTALHFSDAAADRYGCGRTHRG